MQHFRFTVIKAHGIPCAMKAGIARKEKLFLRTVKLVDAFHRIFHRVGMDEIHINTQAELMRGVYEILEVVRRSEPAGNGKEIGNVITEAAVIRMLHDCHELNSRVSGTLNFRQGKFHKLTERADYALFLGNADVCFIDERCAFGRFEILVFPGILFFGSPNNAHPVNRTVRMNFLFHATAIERNLKVVFIIVLHHHFDALSMLESIMPFKTDFPVAVFIAMQGMRIALPLIEIAY